MPRLVYRDLRQEIRPDAHEIVERLARLGYEIAPACAQRAWEAHSETLCAGWLILPDDDEILLADILPHLEVRDS